MLQTAGVWRRDLQTGQEGYTLAAALLFGKDETISNILPYYKTDALVRVNDRDRYDDRDYVQCNLITAYERLMDFISRHLPDKFYMESDQRVSLRTKIFREIIANILVHREFTNAYPATLTIFADRVETANANVPNGVGPISPDRFAPFPKNPTIAKFFIQLGRVEELGSGILNVNKYLAVYSPGNKPEFIEADVFKTIIPLNVDLVKSGRIVDTVTDTVTDTVNQLLGNRFSAPVKVRLSNTSGQVQRSEITPTIYDYRDHKIAYLEKLFQKRNTYYKKIGDLNNLTIDDSEVISAQINENINIAIENLEFKFGVVSFKYVCLAYNNKEIEFDIENLNIRPEFAVLKPYFIRFLSSGTINIKIQATLQNNRLIFKSASSTDLNKIDREVIESVKFRFLYKDIIKAIPKSEQNLLDTEQLQGNTQKPLYANEGELFEDILSLKKYKHHRHLRYLGQRHERSTLKLRYVLEPFSFVFLISGDKQYHLVWETLDTEEATYIWHIDRNFNELMQRIKEIDKLLGSIRTDGRQQFLETNPDNFTRIVHDYSEGQKGFIIWKDQLEEKLL